MKSGFRIYMRIFKKKTQTGNYKPWHGYLILFVIIVSLVLGAVQRFGEVRRVETKTVIPVILSEETCIVSGGNWNSCASSCRKTPNVPCIEVCVPVCECSGDASCPYGTICKDYVNNIGICSSSL